MRKQLRLWPTQEGMSQPLDIWKNLERKQQNQIIAAFAKLIKKIVCPEDSKQTREVNYER